MYSNDYEIKVTDDYTIKITKKAGDPLNNVGKNEMKESKSTADDILKFVQDAGFDAKAEGDKIIVTGKNSDLEKLADDLDANFDNLEIVLDLGKLTISIIK